MGKFAEIERYNKIQITLIDGTIHMGNRGE